MSENSFIYIAFAVILENKHMVSKENRMLKDQNQTHSFGSFYFLVVFSSFLLQVFVFSRLFYFFLQNVV